MKSKWHKSQYPGVRFREHKERKYNNQPDRYFVIRYKKKGKLIGESVGWASNGMNAQKANGIRAEIVQNIKEGKSPQSLAEKRQIEAERIKAENEKREQGKESLEQPSVRLLKNI